MTFIAVGINYNTAPITVRERLAFPAESLITSLQQLGKLQDIREAAILSTCNRTEVYCNVDIPNHNILVDWVAAQKNIAIQMLQPYLYHHTGLSVCRHLFRVSCGLDSMILGEPQILGQVKSAYQSARDAGTLGKQMERLFQHTFSTAKKVRTDTSIGSSPVSVASAAVEMAKPLFGNLKEHTALLIGAGETIELTARHLVRQGIKHIIIANRTYEKAHNLAVQFNGYAIGLAELINHLPEADIIIASTGSPNFILGKGSVESALKKRRHKPMLMIDLAVPRDIEPEISQLEDVYLYTVDDLRGVIRQNMDNRRLAAEQAEDIIDTEVSSFSAWQRSQNVQSTIQAYRTQAGQHRDEALQKAISLLKGGEDPEAVLNRLAHNLTNKLLHTPCSQMRDAAENERYDLIASAHEIFKLPSQS